MNSRKRVAALALTLIAALVLPARAQTYPDHAVRLIIPFPPGGSIDTLGRILAEKLATLWGQFSNCGRRVNPVLYPAPVALMSVVGAKGDLSPVTILCRCWQHLADIEAMAL